MLTSLKSFFLTKSAALALFLAIAGTAVTPSPVLAQDSEPVALGHAGARTFYLSGDSLHILDHDARTWSAHAVPAADTLFHPNGQPAWYSSAVDAEARRIWIWDRSVGPTLTINLDDPSRQQAVWRLSSHVQFDHAGGLDPGTGWPLAFSGYGYYRAKDYILTYDAELQTWVELPVAQGAGVSEDTGAAERAASESTTSTATPAPRMHAVMATAFSDSLIAIVGGTVNEGTDPIPHYSQPAEDTWVLNLASERWTRVPFEPWMECHVRYAAEQTGQLPGSRRTGAAYFWMTELCPLDPEREHLRNSVIEWRPLEGRLRPVASFGRVPEPQKLTMIDVPAAGTGRTALDARSTAVSASTTDSVRVGVLNRKATSDMFGADLIVMSAPIDTSAGWTALAELPEERRVSLIVWMLLGLATVGGGIYFALRAMREKRSATVYAEQERLEIARGRTRTSSALQPHVRLLLESLANVRKENDLIDPDDLLDHFEERYSDLESARAMRNKAYNEVNELAENVVGRPLIERIQREDDRRRYMYRLLMPVRVR